MRKSTHHISLPLYSQVMKLDTVQYLVRMVPVRTKLMPLSRYINSVMYSKYLLLLFSLLFVGCDLMDVHPYDGRIKGKKSIHLNNIARIEQATQGKSQIRFAVISDTQRWFDDMEDEVRSINQRGDIDFVVHCGDMTDFGITKEFDWQQSVMNKLSMPYVVLLGNHDCVGNGKEVYRSMFGKENFTFVAGRTRFICLDTNALEFDFSNPVPDLNYMESFIGDSTVDNTIVVMHVRPFSDEFNDNVGNAFQYLIRNFTHPLFCLCGHGHTTEVVDLFNDGILYYEIANAEKRQYYVFTVKGGQYDCETVDF